MSAWAQLLHFYQPPTQTHDILVKVAEESYRPLLAVLREHRNARIAVNMNAVLTEMLVDHNVGDVVAGLRALHERGQVEFVGSGKFHPILPLVPEEARERSIADNARTNGSLFGGWNPRGFFPPEMCFSMDIVPALEASGHQWVVLSGVACPAAWPTDRVYTIAGSRMSVLFRDDVRSNRISFRETNPQAFLDDVGQVGSGKDAYVLTAMDAETYGHHIRGWERDFLGATYSLISQQRRMRASDVPGSKVRMVLPSELIGECPAGEAIEPHASSWSTTAEDIAHNNPFPLWRSPGNRVHATQWEIVDHCLDITRAATRYAEGGDAAQFARIASDALEPALHSCQFWWASRRPMWDVPMVHRGLKLLSDVLLYGSRSVKLGHAPAPVQREITWRVAAARELRTRLERHLFWDEPI